LKIFGGRPNALRLNDWTSEFHRTVRLMRSGRLINVLNATFERLQGSFEQAARFSADASHQLKTPIAVLRVAIEEILIQPGLSEEHRQSVADLLQQTRRLSSVAENLLLLSRADTGRLALRATEFDLRKLLDGSLEDARILGAGNNLQIQTNVPETLPMKGDQEMISLTVQNRVENAVKYNRRGGKILVSAEKHDHVVQICVGNTLL
jgi:signal transduction histidine kinase